jgi:hypothetical protein
VDDEPPAGAVFARPGTIVSQYDRGADKHLQLDAGFWAVVDLAAQTREHGLQASETVSLNHVETNGNSAAAE